MSHLLPCDGKASTCNAGDSSSILGSGRSPGAGNGNPLQYSYPENSKDRGAWWAIVHGGHKKLGTTERFHFSLIKLVNVILKTMCFRKTMYTLFQNF